MSDSECDVKKHLWQCPNCKLVEVWLYGVGTQVRIEGENRQGIVEAKNCGECKGEMNYLGFTHHPMFDPEGKT